MSSAACSTSDLAEVVCEYVCNCANPVIVVNATTDWNGVTVEPFRQTVVK